MQDRLAKINKKQKVNKKLTIEFVKVGYNW